VALFKEKNYYYLIAGYVIDPTLISNLKPAILTKMVQGAPSN
jgi:hypothetical protein